MLDWLKGKLRPAVAVDAVREAEEAYQRGDDAAARRECLALLQQDPDEPRALCLLAAMAADARRLDEGLQWARRALSVAPQSARSHYAMGRVYEAAGRYAAAESSYREATRLDAADARAHNNLGCVLMMQGRLDEALSCFRRALAIDPAQPQANSNYASIAQDARAQELAIEGYWRQIAANPNDAGAHIHLGNSCAELGRVDEALAHFDRALALDPHSAEAHFARSLVLLLRGDYREGWREYEWRWKIKAFSAPAERFAQPMWDGRALAGETLLLHAEQGFGDTLQFVRYAALAAERCGAVVLECQPTLKNLLHGAPGVVRVIGAGEPLPSVAAHAPLMSLPAIFGTTLDTVPWSGAYVTADDGLVQKWRTLLEPYASSGRRVGLVWAGNPKHWSDRKRSLGLEMLAPLAAAADCTFISLQKGEPAAQASSPPAGMRLVDLTAEIRDFADTAALMRQLDLVVAVDTAVAHLAGALGAPTWLILPHPPEWRWLLKGDRSPWYPTMRLFRRPPGADWSAAIDELARALAAGAR